MFDARESLFHKDTMEIKTGVGNFYYLVKAPFNAAISFIDGSVILARVYKFNVASYFLATPLNMIGRHGRLNVLTCHIDDLHIINSIKGDYEQNDDVNIRVLSSLFDETTEEEINACVLHNDISRFKHDDSLRVQLRNGENIVGKLEWRGKNLLVHNELLGDILVPGDDISFIYPASKEMPLHVKPATWTFEISMDYGYDLCIHKGNDLPYDGIYLKTKNKDLEIKEYKWNNLDEFKEDWFAAEHLTPDLDDRVLKLDIMGLAFSFDSHFSDVLDYLEKLPSWDEEH